jgi:NDP-sugar pyrophosphorylase family protein
MNQGDQSNVEFANGQIEVYDKRNKSSAMEYIDYGLGILNAKAFEFYPLGKPVDLADIYQNLLADGQLAGYEVNEQFYEVGSFEGMHALEIYLKNKEQV